VTAALVEKRPSATLVVTGPTGPHDPATVLYLDELKSLREGMGIAHRVHFLYECGEDGKDLNLPDEAVSDFFSMADLLIFPSLREGFGIPVLEAGLCRLPVFAADIPPVRESGANLVDLFDPEGNPEAVAETIDTYLSGSIAYKLRRRVIDGFTWQAVLKNAVIPLIKEVSGHEHPKRS
jgi:glycosyltransferase involved in cell wall biosynthesis